MRMAMSLLLPRDELSVPVARHLAAGAMEELGVAQACAADIQVALTEACTNVILHSGPGDVYEVAVDVDAESCVIRVIDRVVGFDAGEGRPEAADSAESGRGMGLMHALVDQVLFESRPEAGTIVHLEKSLEYGENSVIERFRTKDA
jgi:serine/threonine-protein kinase RsbW